MTLRVNPNTEYAEKIRQKIRENGKHCPCQIPPGDDTICICKSFKEQMERGEKGWCHCHLYEITGD